MELTQLRGEIDEVDKELHRLFIKRMELCYGVAEYKIANSLPVFQKGREKEVLERVAERSPDDLKGASRVFYQNMMDISKCMQYQKFFADSNSIEYEKLDLSGRHKVAVPGTVGSYNHLACSRIFDVFEPVFKEEFGDVFRSVQNGETEFGILPIVNSTAGSVVRTYELLREYDLKICAVTKLRISHILAVRPGVKFEDIKAVYSHEQGLWQCSEFIKKHNLRTHKYSNTALAAAYIRQSKEPLGAICSKDCAGELGLEILRTDIANATDNFTRFILVSKKTLKSENANTISVCLSLPHQSSSLYRLLTKFSVAGLNLSMIESMPIANTDFDVLFYLDFHGAIDTPEVAKLLDELRDELTYFKFLGNYEEM